MVFQMSKVHFRLALGLIRAPSKDLLAFLRSDVSWLHSWFRVLTVGLNTNIFKLRGWVYQEAL